MNSEALNHYVKSVIWNVDTAHLAECVAKGVDISDKTLTHEGWHRIGRYSAGKQSAYVQANKLRHKWPNLETKVVGVEGQEWAAEVWIRTTT